VAIHLRAGKLECQSLGLGHRLSALKAVQHDEFVNYISNCNFRPPHLIAVMSFMTGSSPALRLFVATASRKNEIVLLSHLVGEFGIFGGAA
jgi:hypothetical protein